MLATLKTHEARALQMEVARLRRQALGHDELVATLTDMTLWVRTLAQAAGLYEATMKSQRMQRARDALSRATGEHA